MKLKTIITTTSIFLLLIFGANTLVMDDLNYENTGEGVDFMLNQVCMSGAKIAGGWATTEIKGFLFDNSIDNMFNHVMRYCYGVWI